jgi:hypothetical protein
MAPWISYGPKRRPIENHGDRWRQRALDRNLHHESLPVRRGHVVHPISADRSWQRRFEERNRSAGDEVTLRADGNRHQRPVRPHVEQLTPVRSPTRLSTAVRRHGRPLSGIRIREALHVNLVHAGLVGGVRDPAAIGRDSALQLVVAATCDRNRLTIAIDRKRPQVVSRICGRDVIDDELAVG